MKRIAFIGGGIVLVIILIVVVLQVSHKKTKLTTSAIIAHNIQYPYRYNANTLYYFTGSSFASYNLQTNTTKSLTPYYFLPLSISSVQISTSGAIFKASAYSPIDQLDGQLTGRGLPDTQLEWWVCNFKTGAITPLVGSDTNSLATNAIWQSTGSAVDFISLKSPTGINGTYTPGLYHYDLQKQVTSKVATIPLPLNKPLSLLWADNYSADYTATDQHNTKADTLKLNFASGAVSTLTNKAYVNSVVSSDGQWMAYINPGKGSGGDVIQSSGDLMTLNLASGQQTKVKANYSGVFGISPTNVLSYSPTPTTPPTTPTSTTTVAVNTLDLGSNQSNQYTIPNTAFSPSNQLTSIITTDDASKPLYLTSLYGDLTALGIGSPDVPIKINTQYILSTPVYESDYSTSYDQGQQNYIVYIKKTPFINVENEVLENIRKAGVDPNQVNIKWYPPDGYTF